MIRKMHHLGGLFKLAQRSSLGPLAPRSARAVIWPWRRRGLAAVGLNEFGWADAAKRQCWHGDGRFLSSLACSAGVFRPRYLSEKVLWRPSGYAGNQMQTRGFLGCGDGEEGSILSKVHEERRVMGYSPEQLFGVVAAVDLYEDFVPWCQRSRVLTQYENGSFDAELEIGFKFLVESYVSHVEMVKPKYIKTTASQSNLFEHLINIWEFNPGPIPGTCDLYFLVDFKFQSPLYRQVASMFFKEVVNRMVNSFSDRCSRVYGPPIPVLENTYGQKS